MRIVVWNLEWAPRVRRERIRARIAQLAPDVLCAPEADRGTLPAGGHVAEGAADWGYGVQERRRKALLWSRWPLEDLDAFGSPGLPSGRYAAATVRPPGGPVRLVAVCVPWRGAHVGTGRRDRGPGTSTSSTSTPSPRSSGGATATSPPSSSATSTSGSPGRARRATCTPRS